MRRIHHPVTIGLGLIALLLAAPFLTRGESRADEPVTLSAVSAEQGAARQAWISPFPKGMPAPAWQDGFGAEDFMELFTPWADWQQAAGRVGVFKLHAQFILSASDSDLQRVVAELNRRRMAIGVETNGLDTPRDCGSTLEVFFPDAKAVALQLARRIGEAGGTLASITYNEPLTFATMTGFPGACGWTPTRVARELAGFARGVQAYYPSIKFGLAEMDRVTPAMLDEFLRAYREEGQRLAFLHWDIDWQRGSDWPLRALAAEGWARGTDVPFGMIYFGNPDDSSNEEWNAHAVERMTTYESAFGGRPDHVIIQSWHRYPTRVLPESNPGSLTWLVNRYYAMRTTLSLNLQTGSAPVVSGQLADETGRPVANPDIRVTVRPLDGPGEYHLYTVSGYVPERATMAAVGFRANMECDCRGSVDFNLYEVAYSQGGGANRVFDGLFSNGAANWGRFGTAAGSFVRSDRGPGTMLRVVAAPGATSGLNGVPFAVTAGAPFTLTFAARVAPSTAGAGYFAIMWGSPGEFLRTKLPLEAPSQTYVAASDAAGRYQLVLPPVGGSYRVTASYPGSDTLWAAETSVTR